MKKIFMTTMAAGVVFLGLTTPAVAETSGTQRFLLIFRGPDVAPMAVATGPIRGVGTYDPVGDRLELPGGTVSLRSQMTTNEFNPDFDTCTATVNQGGTWEIVAGTGAFEGASGQGTARTLTGRVVGVRSPEGCSFGPGAVGVVVLRLEGTASVASAAAA